MTLPRKMKAAILNRLHAPLVLDEVSLPRELGWGQVLVRVLYSGICGSQIGEIDGVKGEDKYLPHLLGHEGSGRVLETGPGVQFLRPGDPVVMHWRRGRGVEARPPAYTWQEAPLNAGYVTTFNEYAVVSENRLTPLPRDFDLAVAPLFGCAVTTGLGVVTNDARIRIGESVVVFGAGGVGLNVVQGAAMVSAWPIVAVDLYGPKLDMARDFGATHAVNSGEQDAASAIRDIVGGRGADVVVDSTGNTEVINLAYELTRPRGRTVLVGVPRAGDRISIYSLPLHFGKVLTGSEGGSCDPTEDIPRYIRLNRAGKLRLQEMITDRFTLEEINLALDKMRAGEIAGRALIEIAGPGT